MLPRNAFNIADWSLRERRDTGQYATLVLRPKLKHAFFRLFFGTGLLTLMTFGLLGLDYEIRRMREKRRLSSADLAQLDRQSQSYTAPFIAAGNLDKAKEIQQSADAFIANLVRERDAELGKLEASHRPWHLLLRSLAGFMIFCGLYLPLSPLWQRVRISREGDELVIRKNILPRTRRIPIRFVADTHAQLDSHRSLDAGPFQTVSHYWKVLLVAPGTAIELYLATAPSESGAQPPCVTRFVSALRRLGNNARA